MPEVTTQHAAAVERKAWNQIEYGEEKVDVVEVVKHLEQHPVSDSLHECRQCDEESPKGHAGQRSCNGCVEFGAWAARLELRHLRHAPENEKRDLAYRNSQTARDDAMTQFMQEDA